MLLPDGEPGQGVEVSVVLGGGQHSHQQVDQHTEQAHHRGGAQLLLLVWRLLGQTGPKDSRSNRKTHLLQGGKASLNTLHFF